MHPVRAFAAASLTPVALIALAALFGGGWIWAALVYMTLFAFAMDQLIARIDPPADPMRELPEADWLSATLALAHFVLLVLVIRALATGGLPLARWLALYVAAALFFGQVSNSNAHELIHRTSRRLFTLGKWVYISLLFGHHTSAHNKVHHRFAASEDDPNTARPGESFYSFAPRAWKGSFVKGYQMEREDIRRRGTGGATPYVTYVLGALGLLALSGLAFGWAGIAVHLLLAAYAQIQLLLSDYVQHYGLQRARRDDGRLEPIGPAHSWNSRHWFTSHMMLNAPRHSDHHAHPARPYPQLELHDRTEAPILPSTLPAMGMLALLPRQWRRVMDRALARWQARQGAAT
ncbi:alkane 1-monooxygenase [Sinisalibacter aestuarii]|uniref:Alkane 1-monooxygenase n=1 Tax=Sinisalibacter aestuarii TaxID=2949426 RepID=A0ABQ5LQG6_9RHOB|nr:alkane 1-monooxygenase [Sinisalibacter aestuarii]GKY87252.1 alkane 1-monooxygenase [Sinisalibacter aestuarii]